MELSASYYSPLPHKKKEWVLTDSDPIVVSPPEESETKPEAKPAAEKPEPPPPTEPEVVATEAKPSTTVLTETQSESEVPIKEDKNEESKRKWSKKVGRGTVKDDDWMALDAQVRSQVYCFLLVSHYVICYLRLNCACSLQRKC